MTRASGYTGTSGKSVTKARSTTSLPGSSWGWGDWESFCLMAVGSINARTIKSRTAKPAIAARPK